MSGKKKSLTSNMKGKVNCTCGWSWNKSDSSAKDMYVCHECGRDNSNNMKNGGWLDNYGKQANYNDSKATASPDMVGDGFSNVGRNYSPAWKGQFQKGGKLKFLQPTSDRLPEGYRIPYDTPSTERATSIGGVDGEPAYLVPEFKYGEPLYNPIEEFKRTGEHLGGPFKTWQEADEWENTVRHPAVENRETIMFPQEKFQAGGSLPGSVGFTYARTKGIPSNGPYAKKTLASAQNGQEMQYYQNGLDFKPKSISRDGGWLNKYDQAQDGYTTGDQVEYGTPEYTEAYNKGEVVTDEGVRSPIALDEVVIQNNYRRPRGFWEQYRDKIVDENKDAGPLGAIIGTPISAITSLPQLAATKLFSGNWNNEYYNMQRPSETMDIQNPYGAMAIDAIADPANLFGVGILTKEKALARLSNLKNINAEGKIFSGMNTELNNMAIQNIERYMAKRTPSNTPLSKELKPYTSRIGEPSISREEEVFRNVTGHDYRVAKELENTKFLDSDGNLISNPNTSQEKFYYGETPITDRPLNKQGFPNPLGILDRIIPRPPNPAMLVGMEGSWNNLSPLNLIPGYGNKLSAVSSHPNFVGFRKFGNSIDDVVESQSLRPKGTGMGSSQIMGEGNWAEPGKVNENYSGVFEATMNPQIEGSNIKLEKWRNRNGIVGTTKEGDVAIPLNDPGLSFNRRLPFSNRYVPIDKEKLINNQFQLSTQLPYVQSLAEKYGLWAGGAGAAGYIANGEKGARENINTINKYTIDPIIDYTKPKLKEANRQFQDLLNSTQRRNGGDIVKDDMGYWNPENWGSPVEIGSNNITMQDVPFDVLGISDTGDTKLMEPGKNYKFKGKKVTEFPMAKNGRRQEQKGLVNLDDLTNFTNYNKQQPAGWLSKYN
jgi:hypothetical protein